MSELFLGLGLFFLGMQMVGENLRRLSGASFQRAMLAATKSPVAGALAGTLFGALMQSATAVTFILVSMFRSGTVTAAGALPVILFCNVGLTALAFITSLDIHPIVAWFVGLSGIAAGILRESIWKAFAGFLLGLGLILFGLESIGGGAAPLEEAHWFRDMLEFASSSPLLGFAVGFAAAALLQSNTGATMLIITLASTGGFTLPEAAPIIYGTNLGAIVLRAFLAVNLDGVSVRLVRFEDLFCLVSGGIMICLHYAELAGVPLLMAGVQAIAGPISLQLALVFLVSNLLPALLLFPVRGRMLKLLEQMFPGKPDVGALKYLSDSAAADPSSALPLERCEIGHLISRIEVGAKASDGPAQDTEPTGIFAEVSNKIETFNGKLMSKNTLTHEEISSLQLLRGLLSQARLLEETIRDFNDSAQRLLDAGAPHDQVEQLVAAVNELLTLGHTCMHHQDSAATEELREKTRRSGDFLPGLRKLITELRESSGETTQPAVELREQLEQTAWILHRMAKSIQHLNAGKLARPRKAVAKPESKGN